MVPIKPLLLTVVVLAAVLLVTPTSCALNTNGLGIFKDLVHSGANPSGSMVVEEDYPQVPSYVWAPDYDTAMEKRSGKFKSYMLNKDNEGNAPDNTDSAPGPVIRSYIPRTSSKRVPGAILNWAFTPNQQKAAGRFHSGYYRAQAQLRPAALE